MKKQLVSYTLILIGAILILLKIIDSFISGEALIPFLTLTGFILIMVGLFLLTRHKLKNPKDIKKVKKKAKRKK